MEAAIKFMTEIAEDYVANKFPVEELTKMRDEKLVAEGIGKPGGKPRAIKAARPIKRPVAASDAIATDVKDTVEDGSATGANEPAEATKVAPR